MQRRTNIVLGSILVCLIGAGLGTPGWALPIPFTVTTTDGTGSTVDGQCSLREALENISGPDQQFADCPDATGGTQFTISFTVASITRANCPSCVACPSVSNRSNTKGGSRGVLLM